MRLFIVTIMFYTWGFICGKYQDRIVNWFYDKFRK